MPTYKTTDGVDRILPGIGKTSNGRITTDAKIENPVFVLEQPANTPAAPASSAAPAATTQPSPDSQSGARDHA